LYNQHLTQERRIPITTTVTREYCHVSRLAICFVVNHQKLMRKVPISRSAVPYFYYI